MVAAAIIMRSSGLRQIRGRFAADAIGGERPFKDNYALLKKLAEM